MLVNLSIKNYALIDALEVEFFDGLSTITGETGAGKSILLGALSLVLGKRADAGVVNDKEKKCIVEAEFVVDTYSLQDFFETHDLDYEKYTIFRREILPSGKSRAFINDTPVTLSVMNELSKKLIDIHSQHETFQLSQKDFQFYILDSLGNNTGLLLDYSTELKVFKELKNELKEIEDLQNRSKEAFEYNQFVVNELEKAALKEKEIESLEKELERISHFEEIQTNLIQARTLSEEEQIGLQHLFHSFKTNIEKISDYAPEYKVLSDRINSVYIEFLDIASEIERESEQISFDPAEMERLNDRLRLLYNLLKKYKSLNIKELIVFKEKMKQEVQHVENADQILTEKKAEIKKSEKQLNILAKKISRNRKKAIPEFLKQLQCILDDLKMKNTRLKINLLPSDSFLKNGKEDLEFLISADKGRHFDNIKKVASGGEMSRIMLGVKAILSKYTELPAIIFDEIDSGVSGEVSNKIAEVLKKMSKNMQVITITHLPQIAASGTRQYKVYKLEKKHAITSNIRLLNDEERVTEIAQMLGGKEMTNSAVTHARQLLGL